jgi:type III pantothenate kinase
MLLAIDLGNTTTVIGVFSDQELVKHWRISTRWPQTADELGVMFQQLLNSEANCASRIDSAIISSVVPPLTDSMASMCKRYFKVKPLLVDASLDLGLIIGCDNPPEVGADRLVNAVAAYERYGGPLIIVDFGTATTLCVVSSKGEYLGGCIAPGVNISAEALYRYTAQLPKVDVVKPKKIIGRDTVTSMQSGLFYGCISLVDGMIERIGTELGGIPQVVATGGLAERIAPYSKHIKHVDPWLTLQGLHSIYEKNRLQTGLLPRSKLS